MKRWRAANKYNMSIAVVFGDVHGRADQLEKLIDEATNRYGPAIDFYTVGDLIDRGPDSKGVIELCIKHDVKGVYGNHDQWLHDFVFRKVFDRMCLHKSMGGKNTLRSYGVRVDEILKKHSSNERLAYKKIAESFNKKLPESHKAFILGLEPYYKVHVDDEQYWLIHAGLKQGVVDRCADVVDTSNDEELLKYLSRHHKDNLLWPRPCIGRKPGEGIDLHIFSDGKLILGHTITWVPIIQEDFYAIDTGCGTMHPWTLTGLVLPHEDIIQIGPDIA